MKKIIITLLIFSLIINFQFLHIQPKLTVLARPGVSAQAAVLIEQQSGRILFSHRHRERLGMASTTKNITS